MSPVLEFVTNNALASTLVGAAIVGLIGWLWRLHQDQKDSNAILDFLIESSRTTAHTFRSTEAIASKIHLTEERVAALCAKHPRVQRNAKEKKSWRLAE